MNIYAASHLLLSCNNWSRRSNCSPAASTPLIAKKGCGSEGEMLSSPPIKIDLTPITFYAEA
jgi:hypothetical protein